MSNVFTGCTESIKDGTKEHRRNGEKKYWIISVCYICCRGVLEICKIELFTRKELS